MNSLFFKNVAYEVVIAILKISLFSCNFSFRSAFHITKFLYCQIDKLVIILKKKYRWYYLRQKAIDLIIDKHIQQQKKRAKNCKYQIFLIDFERTFHDLRTERTLLKLKKLNL